MQHLGFEEQFDGFMDSVAHGDEASGVKFEDSWLPYLKRSLHRHKEIVNSIPSRSDPIRVLDIGTTPLTFFIKHIHPDYEVSTVDITDHMESSCKAMGIQFRMCNLDEACIPFENDYFDLVIFCEVLEHIFAPPTEVLGEIRRVMRAQARLILSVPNIAALYQRLRLLFGVSPLPNADELMARHSFGHGHIHEYTMGEILSLVRTCGLTVVRKQYVRSNIADERGSTRLVRGIYDQFVLLVPPFRSTIHLECVKGA